MNGMVYSVYEDDTYGDKKFPTIAYFEHEGEAKRCTQLLRRLGRKSDVAGHRVYPSLEDFIACIMPAHEEE